MATINSKISFKQPKVFIPLGAVVVAAIATLALIIPTISNAAEPQVNLGSASNFAVLAGSGITNTGTTTANGYSNRYGDSNPLGSAKRNSSNRTFANHNFWW